MEIILVPGLWLDASSWARVVPTLEQAGHRARPLTLPGLEAADADRAATGPRAPRPRRLPPPGLEAADADRTATGLRAHVAAVVAAIDATAGEVVLVAHSAGCGVAHAAVDARPDRVARAVYVGGFPTGDGQPVA